MFRKMRRFKQQLSTEECLEILRSEPRGVLAVLGDDDYPYAVPIDFIYDEESGTICFHGAKEGHKIDALKNCDKVSFCVYNEGFRKDGDWALNISSVIVFGRMKFVEDHRRAIDISRRLCYKFTDDEKYIEQEIERSGDRVMCLELEPEHMTGKLVNES